MSYQRQFRKNGSILILGGIPYILESVEGCGSSTVVYHASYRDELNTDLFHDVLIKELYPLTVDGSIYRKENGDIAFTEDGKQLMEYSRKRFLMGNRINLYLLRQMPSGTSGNINSYEAFGTFYSVLSVHGGKNLKELLVDENKKYSLYEAAVIMCRILEALDVFHQNELLHLDISPDNILLLEEQVLLIDYNSAWSLRDLLRKDFPFSDKPGYSAPEIRIRNIREIGYAADLYSATAVFFHMVMRRRMREDEVIGTGLKRCFTKEVEVFQGVPGTAAVKAVQILLKGLHTLPRKRYTTVREMRQDLDELINRIEEKGVSHSALWESSYYMFKRMRQPEHAYLEQGVKLRKGEEYTREKLIGKLKEAESFLLTGPGGMGKTRILMEIWKKSLAVYRMDNPVFFYISLREYQASKQDAYFIRRYVLKNLSFSSEQEDYQDALHQLELLFERKAGGQQAEIVFLLDGFNEAGNKMGKLLLEIEELSRKSGVGILLTDRSDAVLSYGLKNLQSLILSPLSTEQIENTLGEISLSLPEEQGLRELLSNPMLLFLYIEMFTKEQVKEDAQLPKTKEELIRLYLESFLSAAMRTDIGDQGGQLSSRFILEYMLPKIAFEMKRKKRTILTSEEIGSVSDQCYKHLRDRDFGIAFPEYRGKFRLMKAADDSSQWYDFAVNERLIDRFGLIEKTENGYYELLHDNFLPVLVQMAAQNKKVIYKKKYKMWTVKGGLIACLCTAVGAAVSLSVKHLGDRTAKTVHYTQEEEMQIDGSIIVLSAALEKWNLLVVSQQDILAEMKKPAIMEHGSELEEQDLAALIDRKKEEYETLFSIFFSGDMKAGLEKIEEEKQLFSVDTMEILCERPDVMEKISQKAMDCLKPAFCEPDSIYDTKEKRERLVTAYENYIEAEIQYVSVQLAFLLADMTEEQKKDILELLNYMMAFSEFYDGAGSISEEHLSNAVKSSQENLRNARLEMDIEGYDIAWE